jgi:hypothetical protein
MFVKSVKVKKSGVVGIVVAVLVAVCAVVLGIMAAGHSSAKVYEMNSETKRQEFLEQMGWEVSDEYDECKAVTIPEEFNEVYLKYNELQKQQGFDLEKYKGRNVEVYIYKVKNYPDYEDCDYINCNLIVCDGQLIGGDVCSVASDGFMQGLRKS